MRISLAKVPGADQRVPRRSAKPAGVGTADLPRTGGDIVMAYTVMAYMLMAYGLYIMGLRTYLG